MSGISPGGSDSRWLGFTPLVAELVVAEAEPDPADPDELELDEEPQPPAVVTSANASRK